jgi:hypothetical protein
MMVKENIEVGDRVKFIGGMKPFINKKGTVISYLRCRRTPRLLVRFDNEITHYSPKSMSVEIKRLWNSPIPNFEKLVEPKQHIVKHEMKN